MKPLQTLLGSALLTTATLLALYSCKKDHQADADLQSLTGVNGNTVCSQKKVTLCAGQNFDIGAVAVETNTDGSTTITYLIHQDAPWVFKELQLYAGPADQMPVNKAGNPAPGNFPHRVSFDPKSGVKSYAFHLGVLPKSFTVAAHATVARANTTASGNTTANGTETAWGDGCGGKPMKTSGGGWGTMFDYTASECQNLETPPPTDDSQVPQICSRSEYFFFNAETALQAETWPDVNGDTDQWGNYLDNGKVTVGSFNYSEAEGEAILLATDMAGQDATKAFLAVATLKLSYTGYELDTELNASVVLVEDWLSGMGKLSATNLPNTDRTEVKSAITYIKNWIAAHPCPSR